MANPRSPVVNRFALQVREQVGNAMDAALWLHHQIEAIRLGGETDHGCAAAAEGNAVSLMNAICGALHLDPPFNPEEGPAPVARGTQLGDSFSVIGVKGNAKVLRLHRNGADRCTCQEAGIDHRLKGWRWDSETPLGSPPADL